MPSFVSVALCRRNGELGFRRPRREIGGDITQARKAASRYWRGHVTEGDKLLTIYVVEADRGVYAVSERAADAPAWTRYSIQPAEVRSVPHIVACLRELGVNPDRAPPPPPEVLVINGWTYRRDPQSQEI